jgi:tetratricopeptide (TPR) repeat protein
MTPLSRIAISATILLFLNSWARSGNQLAAQLVPHSNTHIPPQSTARPRCPEPEGPPEDRTYTLRAQAFDDINAGDSVGARHLMRCAIQFDPTDKIALRQEVYLDLSAGDPRSAIEDIDSLRSLGAADAQLEAQEGYIYAEKKDYARAKAAFRRAIETGDSDIRFQALQAIGNLGSQGSSRTLDLNLDSEYLNRYNDGIVDVWAHLYQRIGQTPVRAYLNERLLRDTASNVGPLPEIFDDNAFLTGIGLIFQPVDAHYSISSEANEAYVFYGGPKNTSALVPDFRVTAAYYNVFRPSGKGRLNDRWSLEANGSIGFYSRYQHDMISYLQPQIAYDVVRSGEFRIAPYIQSSFAFDSKEQYYNNIAEAIPGVEVFFKRPAGLALRVEYVRGFYLPVSSPTPNPYPTSYNDFRVRLTWSKSIPLHKRGE